MIASIEEFAALAENTDWESQERLRSDSASEEIWLKIISERPDLHDAVIFNRHIPQSAMRALASSNDSRIRSLLANRRALPVDFFEKLAADSDESVRARIACNKKAPKPILIMLAEDESPIIAEPARKRLESL